MAQMTCGPIPAKASTCSKTAGVGIILGMYLCVDPDTGDQQQITCYELCCCEKNPSESRGLIFINHKCFIACMSN